MNTAEDYIGSYTARCEQIVPHIHSVTAMIEQIFSGLSLYNKRFEMLGKVLEQFSAIANIRTDPIYRLMMQELIDGKLGDVDEMFMSDLIPRYWNLHGLSTVIQGEENATPSAFLTGFHISLYDIDKELLIIDDIPNALQKLISYRNRKFSKKGNEKHLAPKKRALEIAREKLTNKGTWKRQDIIDYVWDALGKEGYKNGDDPYEKSTVGRWIKEIFPKGFGRHGRKKT